MNYNKTDILFHKFKLLPTILQNKLTFILSLLLLLSSNILYSQCPPTVDIIDNASIPCGGSVVLGEEVEPVEPDYTLAEPECQHVSRNFSNNGSNSELTQGGGVYINGVTTTGGTTNINNPNTKLDVGKVNPMGPNAWSTIWYSDWTNHFVETCSGSTFYLNINAISLYNNPPYSARVWIDWNGDGSFTADEIVYTSPLMTSSPINLNNIAIAIPAGQPYGLFRMRIRFKDISPWVATDNANSCSYRNPSGTVAPYGGYTGTSSGNYYFSDEIEDYTVKINCGNSPGGGDLTYQWTPAENVDDPTSPNATATPTETTEYTITVTDTEHGCTGTYVVIVTVEPGEPATFDPIDPICVGETAPILPTISLEGHAGTWNPSVVSNITSGSYTFTPDEGLCAEPTTITVDVNPLPTVNAGEDIEICEGEEVTLNATGAETYTWNNNVQNGIPFTPTGAGTYTVTGVDENGCENTDEVSISIKPTLTFNIDSENPTCGNTDGSITISGLNPSSNYSLSYDFNNATEGPINITTTAAGEYVISNLGQGVYTNFLIESDTECTEIDPTSIQLTEEGASTVTAPENIEICIGESVTLTALNPEDATISWNNGIVDGETFTPSSAGTTVYTVTATISNCSASDQVTVTVNDLPTVNAGEDVVVCEGEQVTLNAIGAETYTWNNSVQNGIPFTPTGAETYTVTGVDENSCENTDEVLVTVIPSFTFDLTAQDPSCGNADGSITITGLEPSTAYGVNYTFNSTTTEADYTSNAFGELVLTDLAQGNYSEFILTLGNCSATIPNIIQLEEEGAPTVTASNDLTICLGEEVVLTATHSQNATINWSPNIVDGQAFTPTTDGTTVYTVTATLDGCSASDQVTVVVHPLPNVDAGNNLTICEGESVNLTASGANQYNWDNGVVNGVSFTPTTSGTYTVIGTNIYGCQNSDDVKIIVIENPTPLFEGDNLVGCEPHTVNFTNLSGANNGTCLWTFGDGTTSTNCGNVSHTYNHTGTYTVSLTITNSNGCTATYTIQNYIEVTPKPIASFTADPMIVSTFDTEVNFYNNSSDANDYIWYFGDESPYSNETNPSHTYPDENGDSYVVTLIATNGPGCSDTAKLVVTVEEEVIFFVPNTFTPDNDHYNEVFKPVFTSGYDPQSYTLYIFNRWGELIFESHDTNAGWDGTYGGDIVKDGTYIWKIEFKEKKNDERHKYVGHINLIR